MFLRLYNEYKKAVMAAVAAGGITVATVFEVLQTRSVSEMQLLTVAAAWSGVYAVWKARNIPQGM